MGVPQCERRPAKGRWERRRGGNLPLVDCQRTFLFPPNGSCCHRERDWRFFLSRALQGASSSRLRASLSQERDPLGHQHSSAHICSVRRF
jgi:hypothetical protein